MLCDKIKATFQEILQEGDFKGKPPAGSVQENACKPQSLLEPPSKTHKEKIIFTTKQMRQPQSPTRRIGQTMRRIPSQFAVSMSLGPGASDPGSPCFPRDDRGSREDLMAQSPRPLCAERCPVNAPVLWVAHSRRWRGAMAAASTWPPAPGRLPPQLGPPHPQRHRPALQTSQTHAEPLPPTSSPRSALS